MPRQCWPHSGRTTALNAATGCASLSSIAPVHQAYGLVADVPVSLYGSDAPRSKCVPAACPIGQSTPGTYGHSRTTLYTGSPANGQADPLRKPTF